MHGPQNIKIWYAML